MAAVKRQKGVIYLEKNRLTFYGSSMANVVQFVFPQGTAQNLDIVNEDLMMQQLAIFIQTNKILPAVAGIVLADHLLFTKDVMPVTVDAPQQQPGTPPTKAFQATEHAKLLHEKEEEQKKSIEKFLDNVPFETVATKTYKLEKGSRVIAANSEYFEAFRKFFEKLDFVIEPIVPTLALGKHADFSQGLTPALGRSLIPRLESLKKESLSAVKEIINNEKKEGKPTQQEPSDKKRVFILVGVFVLLIGLTIFMYMRMQADNAALIEKNRKASAPPPVVQPEVVPSVPVATEEATLIGTASAQLAQVSITIQFAPKTATQAAALQKNLQNEGFNEVETTQQSVARTRTLIVFSNKIAKDIQEQIIVAVEGISSQYTVQQNTNESLEASITLGSQ